MVEMKAVDGTLAFACEGKKCAVYEEILLLLATALNEIAGGDEEMRNGLVETTREALPELCRRAAPVQERVSTQRQ